MTPPRQALGIDLDPRLDGALGSKPGGRIEQARCHSSESLAHYLTALDAMLVRAFHSSHVHRPGQSRLVA